MPLVAGVDIGNSTTEIVVANGDKPIAWSRRPTRGLKGSKSSAQAAAALLRSLEREHNLTVDEVVVAPWKPVNTFATTVYEPAPSTGNLQVVECAQHSVAGDGAVSARPWIITDPAPHGDVIAIVPANVNYEAAAKMISENSAVVGALVERDEAILIERRVNRRLPIIDCVDVLTAQSANRLFLEVRPAGQKVSTAVDIWALTSLLNLTEVEHGHLMQISKWVAQDRATVIGLFAHSQNSVVQSSLETITWRDGETQNIFQAATEIPNSSVGAISAHNLRPTDDLWAIDINATVSRCGLNLSRQTNHHSRALAIAELSTSALAEYDIHSIFSIQTRVNSSEAHAAALGAWTTPGIAHDSLILDIGGGTIDLIANDAESSVAGAGQLLSHSVAEVLAVPIGAADWIKRVPAHRMEAPQILLNEDGTKTFQDSGLASSLMGNLLTPGPSGYLPFGKDIQLAEWRILRHALKFDTIARNVSRLLADRSNVNLIVVGGPAADDELMPALAALPQVSALGKGNIAGQLGHRYSVAYGLTQS